MAVDIASMNSLLSRIREFRDWAVSIECEGVPHQAAEDEKILQLMTKLDSFDTPASAARTTNIEKAFSKFGKPFLYFFLFMIPVIVGDAAIFYFKISPDITGPLGAAMVLLAALAYFVFLFANSIWPFVALTHIKQYDSQLRSHENAQFLHQAAQLKVYSLPTLKEGKELIEISVKRKTNWLRNCVGGSGKIALLFVLLAADRLFASGQKLSQITSNTTESLIGAAVLGVVMGSFAGNAAIARLNHQKSLVSFVIKRRKKKTESVVGG